MTIEKKPTVLIILDGFGVAPRSEGNAIHLAKTPTIDRLIQTYPSMTLRASGEAVGLAFGEMGNSEVGHLAIGSGRVYYQTVARINRSIEDETFFENEAFLNAIAHAKKHKSRLHLMGIMSSGEVHGLDEHAFALLKIAKKKRFKDVFVHAFLDGRDTLYNSAPDFIGKLQEQMKELKVGTLASMSGRRFAMDRDRRWERVEKVYQALILGQAPLVDDPIEALKASYRNDVFDEHVEPVLLSENGAPVATIQDNDAVIFFNFRPDRARELTKAFVLEDFSAFDRKKCENLFFVTMAEYEKDLPVEVAFKPVLIDKCLAQVISEHGLKQLHVGETEKYAHVTFFLNGSHEAPFEGEDRVIVPSPSVESYKLKPEMSAREITSRVQKELLEQKYDFVVVNFANADMVGHSGDIEATKKAVEILDECVQKIAQTVLDQDGLLFITADHGNAEEVLNLRTGGILKEHATNPVPFLIISNKHEGQPSIAGEVPDGDLSLVPPVGMLADVAPTILTLMGIGVPEEMTGQALV